MQQRERQHDDRERQLPVGTADGPAADLHEQAERLLALGADAIDRALSGDSAAFLAGNRQEGGQ
jgi:hypothetical protein